MGLHLAGVSGTYHMQRSSGEYLFMWCIGEWLKRRVGLSKVNYEGDRLTD